MNKNMISIMLRLPVIIFILFSGCQAEKTLESPNGIVRADIRLVEGFPVLNLAYGKNRILQDSPLGLRLDESVFMEKAVLGRIEKSGTDETWKPVPGKVSEIRDHYNEWHLFLHEAEGKKWELQIILRAYDDGIAFRYIIPEQESLSGFIIEEDLTQFNFTGDFTWWSANGERANLGPLSLVDFPPEAPVPIVIKCNDSTWLAIHEAAIYHHSPFSITPGSSPLSLKCSIEPSQGHAGMKTSWRTVFLGNRPGDLLESNLLYNLNPPCKIEDPSWIKPGKSLWDWRVWGYKTADGFEYGLNTVSHKRFVDFAAGNNIDYMLLDADWYGPEFEQDSDPSEARKGINIEEFMEYAAEKGVKVLLYLNDVGAKKYGLENILSRFHDWGAAGVKYGFMRGSGQDKVLHTRQVVELCAKYSLLVDFHDSPVPPSGDDRTWPNLITREYCHAQADAKRSYFPETAVSSAFINMLAGSLDMTNGWYGLDNAEKRIKVFQPIPGTVAAETAKILVFYSGLTVLPDAPEEYLKKADLFEFISKLPNTFDELMVLGGDMDSYISLARRSGRDWYVGSLTNRSERTLDIRLDFLEPDHRYKAILYEDATESHFLNNRESYTIRELVVNRDSVIRAALAPGGGHCARIIPL